MTEFTTLAESTIAMSAYNLLALNGPLSLPALHALICKGHESEVPKDSVLFALNALVMRGFAALDDETETLHACGPAGAPVRWRDRNGDGWEGWAVDMGKQGARALEEVLS
jgi:hypothetical protein